jgi:hypothetical protein
MELNKQEKAILDFLYKNRSSEQYLFINSVIDSTNLSEGRLAIEKFIGLNYMEVSDLNFRKLGMDPYNNTDRFIPTVKNQSMNIDTNPMISARITQKGITYFESMK